MNKRWFVVLGLVAVVGCSDGDNVAEVAAEECASEQKWVGGNAESDLMRPGSDCIGCHTEMDQGPRFLIAGTVFGELDAADDCFGLADAMVQITDAQGSVWDLTTNEAGNFWIEPGEGPVEFPFSAKVIASGMEFPMNAEQSVGSCATCHTQTGANQAPGRIFVP